MIALRPYQQESLASMREAFKEGHKRIVLCLPTGAGKTVVFSEMVRLAHQANTKTLVLTDRTELFKQTIRSLGKVGVPVEEIVPYKKTTYTDAVVFLAMVETFKRRKVQFVDLAPKLIIIDEAHKGSFNPLFELFPDAWFIGATATPVGAHFYKQYTKIIQNIDIPELVEGGYLSKCKAFQMVDDFGDLESKCGEFTEQSLSLHYNKPQLFSGVVEEWLNRAKDKKTIVFNVNIEHTINVHKAFLEAGISSAYITSKSTKEEREFALSAFHNGNIQVLNNCGILTTGYDEPSIECVIVNRATKSLPLWLQCVGRGSRIYEGKNEFIVLDFGGNHSRLGLWNEPREWTLKKKKVGHGVASCKDCPQCLCVLPNSARKCENCGYVYPIEKKIQKNGVMVEVKAPPELVGKKIEDLSLEELYALQKSKKYKPTYIWRVVRSRGVIKEYAHLAGYSDGWIYMQKNNPDCLFTNYTVR